MTSRLRAAFASRRFETVTGSGNPPGEMIVTAPGRSSTRTDVPLASYDRWAIALARASRTTTSGSWYAKVLRSRPATWCSSARRGDLTLHRAAPCWGVVGGGPDELGDGNRLIAAGAQPAGPKRAAEQVAVGAAALAKEPALALGALVDAHRARAWGEGRLGHLDRLAGAMGPHPTRARAVAPTRIAAAKGGVAHPTAPEVRHRSVTHG